MIRLVLPYPPSGNAAVRIGRGKGGKALLFRSSPAKAYRATLDEFRGRWDRRMSIVPIAREIPLRLYVHFLMPDWRSDPDNRIKVLFDALQGRLYENDSQVVEHSVSAGVDRADPRVLLGIECLEPRKEGILPAWALDAWGLSPPRGSYPLPQQVKRRPKRAKGSQ